MNKRVRTLLLILLFTLVIISHTTSIFAIENMPDAAVMNELGKIKPAIDPRDIKVYKTESGVSYVLLSELVDSFGGTIDWDKEKKLVTVSYQGNPIASLSLSNDMKLANKEATLLCLPKVYKEEIIICGSLNRIIPWLNEEIRELELVKVYGKDSRVTQIAGRVRNRGEVNPVSLLTKSEKATLKKQRTKEIEEHVEKVRKGEIYSSVSVDVLKKNLEDQLLAEFDEGVSTNVVTKGSEKVDLDIGIDYSEGNLGRLILLNYDAEFLENKSIETICMNRQELNYVSYKEVYKSQSEKVSVSKLRENGVPVLWEAKPQYFKDFRTLELADTEKGIQLELFVRLWDNDVLVEVYPIKFYTRSIID